MYWKIFSRADKCETIIEIRIEEKEVGVTFEIGLKDAKWFKNIIPIEYYADGYTENDKLSHYKTFFTNDFIL